MSEIAADIIAVAEDIASLIPSRVSADNRTFAALVIARAILAEREFCASIAETCAIKKDWASEIASAIRKPRSLPASPTSGAA